MFGDGSAQLTFSSAHLNTRSTHLRPDSEDLPASRETHNEHRDLDGRLLADQLDAPVIDSLDKLDAGFRSALELLATEPRTKGKLPVDSMKRVVLALCHGHYVTLSCQAQLVMRDTGALRQQYLKPLTKEGKLRLAFPTAPTHAKQAYRSVE